ncbi:hypothetical protein WM40_01915 [Robbsia andropogonis]|uniref:Uncharacterized protein n=1 Tax=Robbsia andropogonis TaxID=28092 RepID=A0A0F5K743_9BURK|nr:hypothetical protein WM40_01915 [Robbsia andropogonis]
MQAAREDVIRTAVAAITKGLRMRAVCMVVRLLFMLLAFTLTLYYLAPLTRVSNSVHKLATKSHAMARDS